MKRSYTKLTNYQLSIINYPLINIMAVRFTEAQFREFKSLLQQAQSRLEENHPSSELIQQVLESFEDVEIDRAYEELADEPTGNSSVYRTPGGSYIF